MKNIILPILAVLALPVANAQKNNPFDKTGTDFVESYRIIKKDYDAGKILELNQKTLDYYSNVTPIKRPIPVSEAATILKTIKYQSLSDALNTTKFSSSSKDAITKAVSGGNIADLVEKVRSSGAPASEKELVLPILSIIYNGNHGATINPAERHGLFWAILGGIVGGAIFGPPGILAGAAVGGAAGEATP